MNVKNDSEQRVVTVALYFITCFRFQQKTMSKNSDNNVNFPLNVNFVLIRKHYSN